MHSGTSGIWKYCWGLRKSMMQHFQGSHAASHCSDVSTKVTLILNQSGLMLP